MTKVRKPRLISIILFCGIFICIIAVGGIALRAKIYPTAREKMQTDLANKLGVRIEDYPYRSSFPAGYFYTILQLGMTIAEVHNIVQGYEKVIHCNNRSEIYYYFSNELVYTKRFKISYDDLGNYANFEGEEDDSRTLQTDGCDPGLVVP